MDLKSHHRLCRVTQLLELSQNHVTLECEAESTFLLKSENVSVVTKQLQTIQLKISRLTQNEIDYLHDIVDGNTRRSDFLFVDDITYRLYVVSSL